MLPILNTNDIELEICAGEALIHPFPPLGGMTTTPWIARKATFTASMTVACRLVGCVSQSYARFRTIR
jgi:hypothetical protein